LLRNNTRLSSGQSLDGGVGRQEKHRHVGGGDDRVEPPHWEKDVDVPELQLFVSSKSRKPSTNVKRTRIDEKESGVFEHEFRRLDNLPELLHFAGGNDDSGGLGVLGQRRRQGA